MIDLRKPPDTGPRKAGFRRVARGVFPLTLGIVLMCGSLFLAKKCTALELTSRYANIIYHNRSDLRLFNNELHMEGSLRTTVRLQSTETMENEVVAKINAIVEKTMGILDMYPAPLIFSIVILPDTGAVKAKFKDIYNVDVDYIAFYSPRLNRVFYSAGNGRLRVVCHEIGHVVVENYFKISPPQRIHEVMAQYVEKHIND